MQTRSLVLMVLALTPFALAAAPPAGAAVGDLTYVERITGNSDVDGCTATPDATPFGFGSGFRVPYEASISPDGESVYVAAAGDDAVIHFDRDPATGSLTYVGCITGDTSSSGCTTIPGANANPSPFFGGQNSGLDDPRSIVASPDGTSVYAGSFGSNGGVASFDRDPMTGALTYAGCIAANPLATTCTVIEDSGLRSIQAVAASADGTSIYAGSKDDDAVVHFSRDPSTGELTFGGCLSGQTGLSGCTAIPSATSEGEGSGLQEMFGLALDPDGESLYAATGRDDSVAHFDRNPPSGELAYVGCLSGNTDVPSCTLTPDADEDGNDSGLDDLSGVVVSPDGASVYASSQGSAAVSHLDRNPGSGGLVYVDCISTRPQTAECEHLDGDVLESLADVAASPDGRSIHTAAVAGRVVHFSRDAASGALSFASCVAQGGAGAGLCDQLVDAGLGGLLGVAISPDDRSAYVVSNTDAAISHLDRELAGEPPVEEPPAEEPPAEEPPAEEPPVEEPPAEEPPADGGACRGEPATILGSDGADELRGTAERDVILALGGDDLILARPGDDLVCAGPGDDLVRGGPGRDEIHLGGGDDRGFGGQGADSIHGHQGDDVLGGRKGNDVLGGGPGNDTIGGGRGDDTARGGKGDDVLRGGRDDDVLRAGSGADTVRGGTGDDLLRGQRGDDLLRGGKGDDRVFGDRGDDQIFGGPGRNLLRSGRGKDRIFAGPGPNRIVAVRGRNRIECHRRGNDVVVTNRASRVIGNCARVARR